MSGMLIALALFGCTDDAATCERLTDKAKSFETQTQCELNFDAAFESDVVLTANYPTVIARCMLRSQLRRIGDRSVNLSRASARLASR